MSKKKSEKDINSSAIGRVFQLGGLLGRVGSSLVSSETTNLFRSKVSTNVQRAKIWAENAERIAETLGNMKGGVMKIGQMLSLQEDLLPPEVALVLQKLQKDVPSVPFSKMREMLRRELKDNYALIHEIEVDAYASASIGQVHKARLRDGREVAIKIQYPHMQKIIKSDLNNLKSLMKMLFTMFMDMDFNPVFKEVKERLLEEINYDIEAGHLERMYELHADDPKIRIPKVIRELSSTRVLTMEFVPGIGPDDDEFISAPQELRNKWGVSLLEFILKGIYRDKYLHADPNLANFAFQEDGGIIVYDFGCVKSVPDQIAHGFAGLTRCFLQNKLDEVPQALFEIGIAKGDEPLPLEMVQLLSEDISEIFTESEYTFDKNDKIFASTLSTKMKYWDQSRTISFPKDIIFIDRALVGHFGNLGRLSATACWRDIVLSYV